MARRAQRASEHSERRERSAEACIQCARQFKACPGVHPVRKAVEELYKFILMFLRCSQDPGTLLAHFECQNKHNLKNIGGATYCMSIVFPRVHPIVLLKRASRSLTKTGFFLLVFHYVFHYFWLAKASKLRSMLDLCWSSSWEASWSDLGRFLGGQDAPKTSQDGAKTGQVGVKTG